MKSSVSIAIQHFVDKINRHIAPVDEPLLQELLTKHKAQISATTDWTKAVAETDITTIIVPTPSGADGAFRNDHVLSVVDEVGRVLARKAGYHLVVLHSTTMPGSVGGPIRQRLERASRRKLGRRTRPLLQSRIYRARRRASTACCIPISF